MGAGRGAFPQRRGQGVFERKISKLLAFEAVLFRARIGCPRCDLPGEYGDDHTLYIRWRRWVKGGVPQQAMVAWYLEAAKLGRFDLSLDLAGLHRGTGAPARGRSRGSQFIAVVGSPMADPYKGLEAIRQVLEASLGKSWYDRLPAYNTGKMLARELREYATDQELGGSASIHEKLRQLDFHMDALFGLNEDNGHDEDQHYRWALGAIDAAEILITQAEK